METNKLVYKGKTKLSHLLLSRSYVRIYNSTDVQVFIRILSRPKIRTSNTIGSDQSGRGSAQLNVDGACSYTFDEDVAFRGVLQPHTKLKIPLVEDNNYLTIMIPDAEKKYWIPTGVNIPVKRCRNYIIPDAWVQLPQPPLLEVPKITSNFIQNEPPPETVVITTTRSSTTPITIDATTTILVILLLWTIFMFVSDCVRYKLIQWFISLIPQLDSKW